MVADDFDWWLLIGDETALPSIGRRVEGLAEGVPAIALVAVNGPAEEQVFGREQITKRSGFIAFLTTPQPPIRDGGAEENRTAARRRFRVDCGGGRVARAARDHIINIRRHPARGPSGIGLSGPKDRSRYDRANGKDTPP